MPPPLEPDDEESHFADDADDDIPPKDADEAASGTSSDDDSNGEEEDGNGEVYAVEAIHAHGWTDDGDLIFHVKWQGYPKEDNTWEPEVNLLEDAEDVVKAYYKGLGGRPDKIQQRKRKANGSEPATQSGRGRGNKKAKSEEVSTEAEDIDTKAKRAKKPWEPPKGTWEKDMSSIDSIEEADDDDGTTIRYAFVVWNNGLRSRHKLLTLHEKAPQKMLSYYYQHLHFKHSGPSENFPEAQNGTD